LGPYVIAVSVVSPFIKFKNASKETIDASEELLEELRLSIMQAGQKLSRHIKKEHRAADYEKKIQHIEQFGPILIEGLGRITKASEKQLVKAREGLMKILGRDSKVALEDLKKAEEAHQKMTGKKSGADEDAPAELNARDAELSPSKSEEPIDESIQVEASTKKPKKKKLKKDNKQTTLALEGEA
jgi:DNA topoisomerase-6 subunit B